MRLIRPRSSGRLRLLALVIAFSLIGSTGAVISLASADGMVMTGRVTAPDGTTGIAGATVRFESWTTGDVVESATRTTDEDGTYSTVLPADQWGYELHAEPPADNPGFYGAVVDYGPDYDGFQVTEAGISGWVTRLAAPTLVGTVLDSTGAPMGGVEVTGGQSWQPATVTSRADGSYGLVLPPYQQQVVATPPDGDLGQHAATTAVVQIPCCGGVLEHDVQLDASTVQVRTLLPDGATPADGALAYASLTTGGSTYGYTDSAGYVGLALPAGEHTLTAQPSPADSGRALSTQMSVTAPTVQPLTVVLPAPNVSGTVRGPGGETLDVQTAVSVTDAMTGAEVGNTFYARPEAGHGFALGLPAGRYVLRAHAPRYSENPHRWQGVDVPITVEEGAALPPLDLELQPEGTAPWRAVQVNTDADGGAPERGAELPAISADGTTVTFSSWATDLLPGITGNGNEHLYVRRVTSDGLAPTELVTVAHDGSQADRGVYTNEADDVGSLNSDGSLVAFATYATNMLPTPTERTHVYLRDLDSRTTTRLSQTAEGTEADGGSWAPSLSADGQRVAFLTQSSNLAGPTDGDGVVLLDRAPTGGFTLLSGESSSPPVLSADGSTVAWQEDAWDDTVNETLRRVRVHRVGEGTVDVAIPVTRSGDEDHYDRISDDVLDISDDGGTVLFVSTVDAYPLEDRDRFWLYDTASGISTEVSPFGGPATESNGGVDADLSGDGRSLVFTSDPPRDAVVSNTQVWTKDLATGVTTLVTGGAGGDGGDSASERPQASSSGNAIVFETSAPDLAEEPALGESRRIYLARPSTDGGVPTWPVDAALAAEDVSTTFFRVVWPAADDDALTGYTVLLDGTELGRVGPLTRSFQVTGLSPATAYDVEVRATDAFGNVTLPGLAATLSTATPSVEPGTAVLSASPQGSAVSLVWDAGNGPEGAVYEVRRRVADGDWTAVATDLPLTSSSYTDEGVPAGAELTYAVHLLGPDSEMRHTVERTVTTPALSLLSVAATPPLLGAGLARLGGTLVVTAQGDAGRAASARVVTRSWYDGETRLDAPAEHLVTVPLSEVSPGSYRGSWTVAEGTAEIVRVEGLLEDGHGAVTSRPAPGTALPVSGAIEVDVTAPPGELDGARSILWSDSLRTGTSLTWAGSPLRAVVPAASDHDLQLVTSDGFAVARRSVPVLPGLTSRPEPIVVTPKAQLVVTVMADEDAVNAADVVVTDTATGALLDSRSSGSDGTVELTDRLRADREVTVTATLPPHLPYLSTTSTTLTLAADENLLTLDAVALPTGRVVGTVTTSSGTPAARAQVTVSQSVEGRGFTWRGETDSTGRYAVQALAGPARATVGWRGLPAERDVTVPDTGDVTADVALPRWSSYPVDVDVFTRLHGATDYNGPLLLDLTTLNDLALRIRGPQGFVSPVGADKSNTVLVSGQAGQTVEVCGSMPFKHLPERCETATLPDTVDTPTTVELRLSAPAAVAASVADEAGALFAGTWDATISRATEGGREVVASAAGSGSRLNLSVPGDGDYTLAVTAEDGRSAVRAVTVASGGTTNAGQLRLAAGEHFSSDANEVLPVRPTVRPGDLADFRASWRNDGGAVSGSVLRIAVPAGTTVLAEGLLLDGAPVTGTPVDGGLDVPLGDLASGASGVVRYQVRVPEGVSTLLGAAGIRFGEREEPLRPSLVRVETVTLKLPEQLTQRTTTASGRAPAGAVVRVVTGGAVLGTATATAAGFWRTSVELPSSPSARSYPVHAEATSGETVLRSAPSTVHYDPLAPALIRMTLSRGGYEYSWNPQDGVASFPFIWTIGSETVVTAQFDRPDLVRNVVVSLGGAKGYAVRKGDRFVADVPRANGRGDIRITYDTVQPWTGLPTTELSEDDVRAGLPSALRDFVALPPGEGEAVPGSGQGVSTVSVPQLGDGAQLRTELDVTSVDYTPTADDRALESAIGMPLWNVQLTEDADGSVVADFYLPAASAPAALRTAALRSVRGSAVAAAGNALHVVLKQGLMGADAVNSVNDSTSVFNDSSGADKKYAAINELSAKVGTCPSTQSGPVLAKLESLVNLAGYADAASVGLGVAGLVLGPETLGASLVVTLIGIGTGKAMDAVVGWATDKVAAEVDALGCPPPPGGGTAGAGGGAPVGAPVYIHDPSGYVYEGMPSARVAGATATLLYSPDPTGPWTIWDAEWFGQTNPLTTGANGRYAWDVPEGFWQVRWTKDGYEPALSEVLEVLPPRFDVNGNLVRLSAPELTGATAAAGGVVELTFDRAMRVITMGSERVTVTDATGAAVPGSVTPVGAELSPADGDPLARVFRFTPATPVSGGTLRVEIGELAQSYASRPLAGAAVREVLVPAVSTGGDGATGGNGGSGIPAPPTPTIPTDPAAPPDVPGSTYAPGEPLRVLDSRSGTGTTSGPTSGVVTVDLTGAVPAGATTALVNLTVTGAQAPGHVTAYPHGSPAPGTSNLNFTRGRTQANLVAVPLGDGQRVDLLVHGGPAHVIADVVGHYVDDSVPAGLRRQALRAGSGSTLVTGTPQRVLDSRDGTGTAAGRKTGAVTFTLPDSVPAGADSVLLNLTGTAAQRPGHVTSYAAGSSRPGTSSLNLTPGSTVANLVLVELGADRRVTLDVHAGPAHVIADLVGWFTGPTAETPRRVLDTRLAGNPVTGLVPVQLSGVPEGASSVLVNLTVTAASAAGHVTAHRAGTPRPATSNLNFTRGLTQANLAVVPVGADGRIVLDVHAGPGHLIADVVGYHR